MGAGRKTQTNTLKEKIPHSPKPNSSVSARNLSKKELGGIIFGCKDHTIKECLSNLLFGLPGSHFSYIKNIHPGMPLFLFNYSDRKLHGIYEAAGHSAMNINPYGWTKNASDLTEYPAQVRVRVRKHCQVLPEEQFKNIIHNNYLQDTKHHFWFELDHTQTGQLISLFEASPLSSAFSYNSPTRIRTASIVDTRQVNQYLKTSATGEGSKYSTAASRLQTESLHPTRKWASLFKENSDSGTQSEKGDMPSVSEVNWDEEGQVLLSDKDSGPASVTACWEEDARKTTRWGDEETQPSGVADCWEDEIGPSDVTPFGDEGAGPSSTTCWEEEAGASGVTFFEDSNQIAKIQLEKETIEEERIYRKLKCLALDRENSNTKNVLLACQMSSSHTEDGRSSATDSASDEGNLNSKEGRKGALVSCRTQNPCLEDKYSYLTHSTSKNHEDVSTNTPDIQSEIDQLRQEMEEIKAFTANQQKKTSEMKQKLTDSCILLQHLRHRVMSLETHLQDSSPTNVEVCSNSFHSKQLIESFDERYVGVGELIFIMGGYDGIQWLSTVDCYSPLRDIVKPVKPMTSVRSYASAMVLNGLIYNIGGWNYYDKMWCDTVECYNPMINEWVSCPSLSEKKGCLAGAVLNNKIFAVGGGNGRDSFKQVEMFDQVLGRWIPMQSMLHKRFATASAELDGVLYVAGGYDGKKYLKSVERFDPREASWSRLQDMSTRRGSHALTNFQGKLYALGGYDGSNYVSSVEVFDPLMGTWFEGDEMKQSRGYFYAPVIGDLIFAIGGQGGSNNIVDKVETYRLGHGWSVTSSNGIGNKCFFSAALY